MYILLIEDDDGVAELVGTGMAEAGHRVVHERDGQAGLAQAMAGGFDVMVFDRQLPGGMDGTQVLQALRAKDDTTPVLFLSALGALQDWMTGLDAGGDDYVTKPFQFAELLRRVEALHQRHVSAHAEAQSPGL